MSDIFDSTKLKCLPLYGEPAEESRLFHLQRLELEWRAAFVRMFRNPHGPQLDPLTSRRDFLRSVAGRVAVLIERQRRLTGALDGSIHPTLGTAGAALVVFWAGCYQVPVTGRFRPRREDRRASGSLSFSSFFASEYYVWDCSHSLHPLNAKNGRCGLRNGVLFSTGAASFSIHWDI
jgi:hypothetical protein